MCLVGIGKSVFGDEKERTRIDVQMKKLGCFYYIAELIVCPPFLTLLMLQHHTAVFKMQIEMIFKGAGTTINGERENEPERHHQGKPKQ